MKKSLLALPFLFASVVGPASAIVIDGDFSDFGAGTIVDTSTGNIVDLRVDSDASFVYVNYNYAASTTPSDAGGTFVVIDIDNDAGTGFDIFGLGAIGSEAAYQNDFPFSQDAVNFNNGLGLLSAAVVNSELFAPVTGVEIAIPISATLSDGTPLFTPGEEVTIGVFTNGGEFLAGTATVVPEPASLALIGLGGLAMFGRRGQRA